MSISRELLGHDLKLHLAEGVGPVLFKRLIEHFGDVEAAATETRSASALVARALSSTRRASSPITPATRPTVVTTSATDAMNVSASVSRS